MGAVNPLDAPRAHIFLSLQMLPHMRVRFAGVRETYLNNVLNSFGRRMALIENSTCLQLHYVTGTLCANQKSAMINRNQPALTPLRCH